MGYYLTVAVRTFTSITPTKGHTGGRNLVEIIGSGFQVAGLPPLTGGISEPVPPTVEVLFEGVASSKVSVVSDTRMFALAPLSPFPPVKASAYGEGDADITINNIDTDGVLIPGETVTAADVYKYRRVQLSDQSDLVRLCRTMIQEWRRQVITNVTMTTNTDFDSETADLLNITDLAKLPGVVLLGPDMNEDRFFSLNQQRKSAVGSGEFTTRRVPYTVDIEWGILGISDRKIEGINLMAVVQGFFERNKVLRMDRDPADLAAGAVEYEIDLTDDGDLSSGATPNNSNLRTFSGRFVLRGFDIEDAAGFPGDLETERNKEVDTINVGTDSFDVGP